MKRDTRRSEERLMEFCMQVVTRNGQVTKINVFVKFIFNKGLNKGCNFIGSNRYNFNAILYIYIAYIYRCIDRTTESKNITYNVFKVCLIDGL